MEERARIGLPAVRAAILGGTGSEAVTPKVAPRKTAHERLAPAVVPRPGESDRTNTGRRPIPRNVEQAKPAAVKDEKPQEKAEPEKSDKPQVNVKTHTKFQLLAIAKENGVNVTPAMSKAEIVAAIESSSN